MTPKQKKVIAWLKKTYGKFSYGYLKSGEVHLKCQDKSYPIQFWVDKEGLIR